MQHQKEKQDQIENTEFENNEFENDQIENDESIDEQNTDLEQEDDNIQDDNSQEYNNQEDNNQENEKNDGMDDLIFNIAKMAKEASENTSINSDSLQPQNFFSLFKNTLSNPKVLEGFQNIFPIGKPKEAHTDLVRNLTTMMKSLTQMVPSEYPAVKTFTEETVNLSNAYLHTEETGSDDEELGEKINQLFQNHSLNVDINQVERTLQSKIVNPHMKAVQNQNDYEQNKENQNDVNQNEDGQEQDENEQDIQNEQDVQNEENQVAGN